MTQERETELFTKVDRVLDCLTGDPLANPPRPGLVQRVDSHTTLLDAQTQKLEAQAKKTESLEEFRQNVRVRTGIIAGGFAVVAFLFNRAWEWIVGAHK